MKANKFCTGLLLPILLLTNCTSLSELPTSWGNNAASEDIMPTGFNPETKTGWMSFNDSTHIYFAFSFFDQRVQYRILNSGMTVFIDTTGKMKEGCFVRFPVVRQVTPSAGPAGQRVQPRQGAGGRGQRPGADMLLNQSEGFELQWQKGKDVNIQVNPAKEITGFKTLIGLDSANILNMVIGVPLKMINPRGLQSLDKLSIGLRFGQTPTGSDVGGSRSQMSGGNQESQLGGSNAGSGGGGRGGGGGGRGGGGGGGGGSRGGGGGGGVRSGADMSPVEFWYKTKLARK